MYPVLAALSMAAVLAAEGWLGAAGISIRADAFVSIYEAALGIVAVGFPLAVRARRWAPAGVSELVVELGPQGGLSAFATAMGRLVEDPSLGVFEWDQAQAEFVDEQGRRLDPAIDAPRILSVDEDGEPLAVVLHRAGSLSEPGMAQAAIEAARLAVHHTRLRREEQAQIAELTASRGRLAASAEAQRTRIEHRLRASVAEPAAVLSIRLANLESGVPGVDQFTSAAADELGSVAAEMAALTRGMRPPVLASGGLSFAVAELANRSALDVRVDNRLRGGLTSQIETAAYFVCAEALANAAKHSGASAVEVILDASEAQVWLSIRDDGVGGADMSKGTGLAGLSDRLAALGGRFEVASPAGAGTALTAEWPLLPHAEEGV
jgi:signal transduction histidine kinase